ncbi:uncharacterized protein [Apostichopus japonicus]|uniref:uncharacterized protein n=1 Tax=Stichopus japonicus TaxID=307972 RepID=UPI003AB7F2F6
MAEQLERDVSGSNNEETTASRETVIGDSDLTTMSPAGLNPKNQNSSADVKVSQDLKSEETEHKDDDGHEEDFASNIVSNVLEKVIKQLTIDHSQGDTVHQDVGALNVGIERCDLNQGTGDHNQTITHNAGSLEPIVVPTEKNYAMDDYPKREIKDEEYNGRTMLEDHDRMTGTQKVFPEELEDRKQDMHESVYIPSEDGQKMVFRDDEMSGSQRYVQDPGEGGYPQYRLHDDSVSQMDKASILSSGVLEIKIPGTMDNSFCADHHPGAMPQGIYISNHPMHYRNLEVSHSYPPPTEMFSSHASLHQQTISPRSSPSQRLMQFPKLRTSATTSGKKFLSSEQRTSIRFSQRLRLPPSIARMSTVMTNTRERTEKQRMMSTYYEERSPSKLLTLEQCINSRPPMPFDLDTPGPCRYTPNNQPLYERNSPRYTFGNKYYERNGGGRTAFSKTWFNSENNFTTKTNFEDRWPSPANNSTSKSQLGRKLPTKMTYPSFTIGVKSKYSINKRGSEKEPSPSEYNPSKADGVKYNKAPSFSMTFRHRGTSLWSNSELSPAPDLYNPRVKFTSSKPHRPAFTIQGIRRPKSHALGPHATF